MTDLYLSEYAEALRNEPDSRAHMICYGGPTDPPGKIQRNMRYIQGYLSDLLEKKPRPVTVIDGGYRNEFAIELWIVPEGRTAPVPTGSISRTTQGQIPFMYDQAPAHMMEYNDKPYLSFGDLCTLTYPVWGDLFNILQKNSGMRAHITIYVSEDDTPRYANKLARFLRADLKENYPEEVEGITMTFGGKREWSQIEIWVVPKEKANSGSVPGAKRLRAN